MSYPDRQPEASHGPHTLRHWRGTIVGVHGDDVFVELGPRKQGVISRRQLGVEPRIGDSHDFTLRGREDSLWVLARVEEPSLSTWREMEVGSLVQARVLRKVYGGLQLKVGALHAFMPRSHAGLDRREDLKVLVGRTLTCEVLEIEHERQRVILSRKLVLAHERESRRGRDASRLVAGKVVSGRVSRIEDYGVFVQFGVGLEGLVHVSDLAHERIEHPSQVLQVGASVEAKVLAVRAGGRRIRLGIKQMHASPWAELEREHYEGQIVAVKVTRVLDFGVLCALRVGVEGLLPLSALGLAPGRRPRDVVRVGEELSARILELDCPGERLALSRLHADGSPIALDEAERARDYAELAEELGGPAPQAKLGRLLGALDPEPRREAK
jgi:ribosomal protein S1